MNKQAQPSTADPTVISDERFDEVRAYKEAGFPEFEYSDRMPYWNEVWDALVAERKRAEKAEDTIRQVGELPDKWVSEYHNRLMGDDDFKHGRKVALHQAANAVQAIIGDDHE